MPDKPEEPKAAMFAWMIPHLQKVARIYGYALAVHGSMNRDLDLIAVPWTEGAASNETLAEAIRDAVDGFIRTDLLNDQNKYDLDTRNPGIKPHGRRCWAIYFAGRRFYIDLAVMPRIVTNERKSKLADDNVHGYATAPAEIEEDFQI